MKRELRAAQHFEKFLDKVTNKENIEQREGRDNKKKNKAARIRQLKEKWEKKPVILSYSTRSGGSGRRVATVPLKTLLPRQTAKTEKSPPKRANLAGKEKDLILKEFGRNAGNTLTSTSSKTIQVVTSSSSSSVSSNSRYQTEVHEDTTESKRQETKQTETKDTNETKQSIKAATVNSLTNRPAHAESKKDPENLTNDDLLQKLTLFYTKHNPSRLSDVSTMMDRFEPGVIWDKLAQKYGEKAVAEINDSDF